MKQVDGVIATSDAEMYMRAKCLTGSIDEAGPCLVFCDALWVCVRSSKVDALCSVYTF